MPFDNETPKRYTIDKNLTPKGGVYMEDPDNLDYERIIGEFSFLISGGCLENWLRVSEGDLRDTSGEPLNINDIPPEILTPFYRKLRRGEATKTDIERLRKILHSLDLLTKWAANVLTAQTLYRDLEELKEHTL